MYSQRLPFFLRVNNIGVPVDDLKGQINKIIIDLNVLR